MANASSKSCHDCQSLFDVENAADDEHEETDCGNSDGGQEMDDACLCPHPGSWHLPIKFLGDEVAFFLCMIVAN